MYKSFQEHIEELKREDWDYYNNDNNPLKIPFGNNQSHTEFIKQYFRRAGKGKLLMFNELFSIDKIGEIRVKHSNSIFFLGILLFTKTKLRDNADLNDNNFPGYKKFPFLWFLTALFHDLGYYIEKKQSTTNGINSIDDLKERFSIENCLLNQNIENINQILFESIENYFLYRLKSNYEKRKIDHGIIAGLFLYDKLVKIRRNRENEMDNSYDWHVSLEEQYKKVTSAIATHNIHIPTLETRQTYIDFEMNSLATDYKPISYNDFHLLYILGIVDTIDPIKTFKDDNSGNNILKNVLIDFCWDSISIKIIDSSNLSIERLTNNVCSLKNWLNIGIVINQNDKEVKLLLK